MLADESWTCPLCESVWSNATEFCSIDNQRKVSSLSATSPSAGRGGTAGATVATRREPPAPSRRRRRRVVGLVTVLVLAAVAMTSGIIIHRSMSSTGAHPTVTSKATTIGANGATTTTSSGELTSCPKRIVIQLNGLPAAEDGALFNLLSDDLVVDPTALTIVSPMQLDGRLLGPELELRTGVLGVQFPTVEAVLSSDADVLLGVTATDFQIADFAAHPTVGVVSLLRKSSLGLMWNATVFPSVQTIADLAPLPGNIEVARGSSFEPWLGGMLKRPVSNDLDLSTSIATNPALLAQTSVVTIDPDRTQMSSPTPIKVGYQLLDDAGWQPSTSVLAVRADRLDADADCLSVLVPIVQRAEASFETDPQPGLDRIVKAVPQLRQFWSYSSETASNAYAVMQRTGIISADPQSVIGPFDAARVSTFVDIYRFTQAMVGIQIPGMPATDLYTNRFIDRTVVRQNG